MLILMQSTFRSLWIWTVVTLLILLWLPLLAIVRLFDRDPVRYRTGRWFRRLGAAVTRVIPSWRLQIENADIVRNPRNPYVVVANHQSMADIPLISRLPWEMKWIGKEELFKLPILGWMMQMAGDIPVRRGDKESGEQALREAQKVLQQKCSVMFFPEGTRSRNGQVLPFKKGAFKVAIEAQVPILPIVLDGSTDCLPKSGWKFGAPGDIRLKVLPPVSTTGLTLADEPALRERVRQQIIQQLAQWRETSPESVDATCGNKPSASTV